jgi:hypothetical protein
MQLRVHNRRHSIETLEAEPILWPRLACLIWPRGRPPADSLGGNEHSTCRESTLKIRYVFLLPPPSLRPEDVSARTLRWNVPWSRRSYSGPALWYWKGWAEKARGASMDHDLSQGAESTSSMGKATRFRGTRDTKARSSQIPRVGYLESCERGKAREQATRTM